MSSVDVEKLNELMLKVLDCRSLDETYKNIVFVAAGIFKTTYGSIYIKNGKYFQRVYSTLPQKYQVDARRKGFIYEAFKSESIFMLPIDKISKYHKELEGLDIFGIVYIPITFEKTKIGVLSINIPKKKRLTPKIINTLNFMGSLASLAINKAQAYQDMAEALDTRDKFISLAAHELRTPLTSIHGYIQLLHKRFIHKKSQERLWIDELYAQTHRLIYIVNELLDITRINSKKQRYVKSTFNVVPIIERVIARYSAIHSQRKYNFVNDASDNSIFIKGDPEKIDNLISHILDNAEKFSNEESPLSVVLTQKKNQIGIKIVNRGTILPDDLLHLFQKYYKGENNMNTGMGLGLYLAKDIVKHHNGKISIRRSSGDAIEASVCLPKLV